MNATTYVKADGDARCITIVRETAGSYIVRLDHVLISGAIILKEGKEWSLYTPMFNELYAPMTFRTLKDAKAHMLSWFKLSYVPDMNAAHAEALAAYTGTRTIAVIKSEGKISRMDYPVPYGRVVTEAHVKICKEYGCVSYVNNGIDQGYCPRCGEVTTSEEQVTAEEINPMDRIREVMTNGTAFQPAFMKNDSQEKAVIVADIETLEIGTVVKSFIRGREHTITEIHSKGNLILTDDMGEVCYANRDGIAHWDVISTPVSEKKEDPRNFDSLATLTTLIENMTPLADKALAACEATVTGPVREMHYQAYQDITRAMDEMRRSLAFFDQSESA